MTTAWNAASALTDAEKRKLVVELVKVLEREEDGLRDVPPTPAFVKSATPMPRVETPTKIEADASQVETIEALLEQHPEAQKLEVALTKLLRFEQTTLMHVVSERRAVCASMAFRVARVVGIGIDDLLAGKWPEAGTCTRCGYQDPRGGKRYTPRPRTVAPERG